MPGTFIDGLHAGDLFNMVKIFQAPSRGTYNGLKPPQAQQRKPPVRLKLFDSPNIMVKCIFQHTCNARDSGTEYITTPPAKPRGIRLEMFLEVTQQSVPTLTVACTR